MTKATTQFVDAVQPHDLISVGDMINRIIDFDQSKSRQRSSVKSGVDVQLDELKRRYDGMGSFLTEVAKRVNCTLPEWACQYIRSCIFLPQLGFLMVIELDLETGNGKYEGEGTEGGPWEKLFTADGAVCYKNGYMKELDDQYGDMYCEIGGERNFIYDAPSCLPLMCELDREVEIIHDLATKILKYEEALVMASDVCGKLDAILALAIGAGKYGWTAPQMTTDNILQISEGRHPLQELVLPSFVPNGCHLAGGKSRERRSNEEDATALVLTGPNHSGKSVYIKQIAIIVYLAHIGSFIPAEQATIGLTDRLLTRISTRESMAFSESAFAIDLKRVAQAVRHSTAKSLVIIDEFGKGTNVDDGVGLLTAFIDHFLSLGSETPRVLLATHFHELLEGGYLKAHKRLRLGHMDIQTDWEAGQMEDQVTYLFRLTQGYSSSSFGARCAALNGVPSSIVGRAEAIALLLSRNEDLRSACAKLSAQEQQELEAAEIIARRFVRSDFSLRAHGTLGKNADRAAVLTELWNVLSPATE